MNRRGFLGMLGGLFAAGVLNEVIPLGRVWSFPSKIVVPAYDEFLIRAAYSGPNQLLTIDMITREALRVLNNELVFKNYFDHNFESAFKIGETVRIARPARYSQEVA